jgi:hypothetical protein
VEVTTVGRTGGAVGAGVAVGAGEDVGDAVGLGVVVGIDALGLGLDVGAGVGLGVEPGQAIATVAPDAVTEVVVTVTFEAGSVKLPPRTRAASLKVVVAGVVSTSFVWVRAVSGPMRIVTPSVTFEPELNDSKTPKVRRDSRYTKVPSPRATRTIFGPSLLAWLATPMV